MIYVTELPPWLPAAQVTALLLESLGHLHTHTHTHTHVRPHKPPSRLRCLTHTLSRWHSKAFFLRAPLASTSPTILLGHGGHCGSLTPFPPELTPSHRPPPPPPFPRSTGGLISRRSSKGLGTGRGAVHNERTPAERDLRSKAGHHRPGPAHPLSRMALHQPPPPPQGPRWGCGGRRRRRRPRVPPSPRRPRRAHRAREVLPRVHGGGVRPLLPRDHPRHPAHQHHHRRIAAAAPPIHGAGGVHRGGPVGRCRGLWGCRRSAVSVGWCTRGRCVQRDTHPHTHRPATSVCRLPHDPMEQGPTEPRTGRSTFLLSSGGAGGGYY